MLKAKDSLEFLQEGMKKKDVKKIKVFLFVFFLKRSEEWTIIWKGMSGEPPFYLCPKEMVEQVEQGSSRENGRKI